MIIWYAMQFFYFENIEYLRQLFRFCLLVYFLYAAKTENRRTVLKVQFSVLLNTLFS